MMTYWYHIIHQIEQIEILFIQPELKINIFHTPPGCEVWSCINISDDAPNFREAKELLWF